MLYSLEDDELVLEIDYSWSNDHSVGLRGSILAKRGRVEHVSIESRGVKADVVSWFDRPDLAAKTKGRQGADAGFWVQLPVMREHEFVLHAQVDGVEHSRPIRFSASPPEAPEMANDARAIWDDFVRRVNEDRLSVLEVGSRAVSPGGQSKRSLFPDAASYTGFDYHPDSNTDVVGDAHRLSDYFPDQRFGAVFSISVLEHLAMPWLLPVEINKVLVPGGLTFHHTHQTWPVHELPWDFFRFSENAHRTLFCRALGFETISSGMFAPVRVYHDSLEIAQEALPAQPAFGGSVILARKAADVDEEKFRWEVSLDELSAEFAGEYPFDQKTSSIDQEAALSHPRGGAVEQGLRHLWRRLTTPR